MNNIGDRIKEVRNSLGMTQSDFGERIGLKQAGIGQMENGSRNVTERTIILICSTFGINEEWLRTGNGDMHVTPSTFSLDEYAQQKGLTDLEFDIVKSYMELDPDVRKAILATFKNTLSLDRKNREKVEEKIDDVIESVKPKTDAPSTETDEPSLEDLEEEYKKRHSKSVSNTDTPASNGTEEDSSKVV